MVDRPKPRELSAAYRRLGSVPAVAAELGVAYETARRWLLEADVPLRSKGQPTKASGRLDIEEMSARYRAGESIASLGAAHGVSPSTIRARLIDAGVDLRPRPGWAYRS